MTERNSAAEAARVPFWKFQNAADGSAELLLYGDIADSTWYEDDTTPRQFKKDLDALGAVGELTVRINSGGGDVFAAQTIGNLLEQHPARVTARIDGLCASAATIVACHCDRVEAARDSTYMIHPVRLGLLGYFDAADLRQYLEALAATRENIVDLYARRTGREKDAVAAWMDATSWWTGPQAKENGFVDELVQDGEDSVVENRNGVLFVNRVNMHLPFAQAPEFVQNSLAASPAATRFVNTPSAPAPKDQQEEETPMEINTVDELRQAYPALVDQLEQAAATQAAGAERARIHDIEEMALPGSEELTAQAKYTQPMSAADYAQAALKRAREQGGAYRDAAQKDAAASGANQVGQTPPANNGGDTFLDAIKSLGPQAER